MVVRISSVLIVALALIAACGQKVEQPKPPNLAALADDEVQFAILDYAHAQMAGRYDQEAAILAAMPAGIRALYYWNSTGKFADEAVAAFEYFSARSTIASTRWTPRRSRCSNHDGHHRYTRVSRGV